MQELMLTAPGKLSWKQAKEPQLTTTGALVRPIAVSTCDFDHLMCAGHVNFPLPLAIGHECVAEVISVGGDVNTIQVGDRVVVSFQVSCGVCHQCKAGRSASCEAVPWLSSFGLGAVSGNWGGAMSDILAVAYADSMLFPIPKDMNAASATCLSCNMSDAYRCVAPQLGRHPEAPVVIVAGTFDNIALYSAGIATSLGASQVDIYGINPSAYEKVEAMGANVLMSSKEVKANQYPIAVDASMDIEKLGLAIKACAPAGEITLSTMYPDKTTPIPLMQMFEKCLSLTTGQPDLSTSIGPALQLLLNHKQKFDLIMQDVKPWDEAPTAFSAGMGKHVLMRD